MAREYLQSYPGEVKLSESARLNLETAKEKYAFTGVMEIATGIVDLCAAAEVAGRDYKTITPDVRDIQMVGTLLVQPIVHGVGGTSHEQLSAKVVASRVVEGDDPTNGFCGFTVRFNPKPAAEFSGTSRSLNSGEPGAGFINGELEECLRLKIMDVLRRIVISLGWTTFEFAPPSATPDRAAAQRLLQQGITPIPQSNRQAVLQGIQAFGKKG